MTATLPLIALAARVTLAEGPAPLRAMLLVHVLAGAVALVTGYFALYAAKGSALHRKSGMWFVYSIVTMGALAVVINVFEGEDWGGGLVVAYFVLTALTTVRPAAERRRWLEVGGMLVAGFLGVFGLVQGIEGVTRGPFVREGVPAPMILFMSTVLLLAAVSDVRVIRRGGLHGRPRLVRHLWRMCFALFIAAGSFFIGQGPHLPGGTAPPRADRRARPGAPARHAVLGLAPAPQEARAGVGERRRERSAERALAGVGGASLPRLAAEVVA